MRGIQVGRKVFIVLRPTSSHRWRTFWSAPSIVKTVDGNMVLVQTPPYQFESWYFQSEVTAIRTKFRFPQSAP